MASTSLAFIIFRMNTNIRLVIFNWQTNTETRLPNLPNGQRVVYPMSGVGTSSEFLVKVYALQRLNLLF